MSVTTMDIIGRGRGDRPILGLNRPTKEALAIYCARRWPTGRRKAVEAEFGLTPEQARSVIEGNPSTRTLDDVWRAGGWNVILPVLGAVVGHGVGDFFSQEAARARNEIEQAAEYERACRQAELVALRSFDPRLADRDPHRLGGFASTSGEALGGQEPGGSEGPLTAAPGRRARP